MGDRPRSGSAIFSDRKLRLVRFDPEQRRPGGSALDRPAREAEAAFADAFPLLVASSAG